MANIKDVKRILKQGIRFGAVGRVHPKQIDEAADRLLNAGTATREVLEQIGLDAIGDRLLFNDVDVDELQKVLEKKEKPEVVE
jgi:hypothetical protein